MGGGALADALTQPIPFDELVAKCLAKGIRAKGWKDALRKWLDQQVRALLPYQREEEADRYRALRSSRPT